jgi:hypothetical protein
MLNAPDLSGFDLDDLSAGLLLLTQRQHRCLRQAAQIAEADGRPGISAEIDVLDRSAASAAEAHRLVAVLRRFAADEGHARPRATVTHLRAVPAAGPPRLSIFARAMAILGRGEPTPSPVAKRDAA